MLGFLLRVIKNNQEIGTLYLLFSSLHFLTVWCTAVIWSVELFLMGQSINIPEFHGIFAASDYTDFLEKVFPEALGMLKTQHSPLLAAFFSLF